MRDPRGLVIAVTGGARGIGAAAAANLARKGAKVAIGDLDGDAAAKTAADIPGAFGLRLDVSDPGSYRAFLDEVAARLGPSDVLVANAGGNVGIGNSCAGSSESALAKPGSRVSSTTDSPAASLACA